MDIEDADDACVRVGDTETIIMYDYLYEEDGVSLECMGQTKGTEIE